MVSYLNWYKCQTLNASRKPKVRRKRLPRANERKGTAKTHYWETLARITLTVIDRDIFSTIMAAVRRSFPHSVEHLDTDLDRQKLPPDALDNLVRCAIPPKGWRFPNSG
jgi:hypothetical protein